MADPNSKPRKRLYSLVEVLGVALLASSVLGGCTTWTPQYVNVTPVTGPAPYVNRTPMQAALVCLQGSTRATPDIRLGVADFVDGSGASLGESDVNGRYFSQRPDLMLIVALSKTGIRLVNRTSTAVAEWEMRQAMDRRLGEGKPVVVGQTRFDYRPVRAGEFLGSNFYVNGAITEINWSLNSNVEEGGFLGATAGRRTYRVSIAIDLVVTNSLTTEVVFARSYSKQLVGYETGAGVFRFVEATIMPKSRVELFQANIGQKQNEPVQAALRWLIELAGYETVAALTGGDARCDAMIPGQMGGPGEETAGEPSRPEPQDPLQQAPKTQVPAVVRSGRDVPPSPRQTIPAPVQSAPPVAPIVQPPSAPAPGYFIPREVPRGPANQTRTRATPVPIQMQSTAAVERQVAAEAEGGRQSVGDDQVPRSGTVGLVVSDAHKDIDQDSYQLRPPAPTTRPIERGEEPQNIQPYQPSGQLTMNRARRVWAGHRPARRQPAREQQVVAGHGLRSFVDD